MSTNEIRITLTKSEALVLFEMLSRYGSERIDRSLTVFDAAERQALWNLCSCLEKELAEPVSRKYDELLAAAKTDLTYDNGLPFLR